MKALEEEQLIQTVLWRRLDTPGHDACALWHSAKGWRLQGTAAFIADWQPCNVTYEVACDSSWRTLSASVMGWVGKKVIALFIENRSERGWSCNGTELSGVNGLQDIDLGFTPATNLIQFRRLNLDPGDSIDAPVVYLHFPELIIDRLDHWYSRKTHASYDYKAPRFNYAAILDVSPQGFITRYPGLWEAEGMN